jgi:hypothetical protein
MADYLASRQQADGGWAYGEGIEQTDVDDTVYWLEFLRSVGQRKHAGHESRAISYLLATPGSDDGVLRDSLRGCCRRSVRRALRSSSYRRR